VAVALLLRQAGLPEQVVAAALLHDVLEDTATSPDELRERFGPEIADLVGAVTESSIIVEYDRRKAALRGQAVEAGSDSAAILAADKLARFRKLNRTGGRPRPEQLNHYRESLALLRARRPGLPLVDELARELERLDEPD
jgi:(p)ppGpp synthase/HD superfamily hydrolase